MVPAIQIRMPPGWFFKFPPDTQPPPIPPPSDARTFAAPFAIPQHIYEGALDHRVPITIGLTYATTVVLWNRWNRSRGYKPFGFSQTSAFKAFVIAHNVFLAVFSALTFVGMLRALAHIWPGREHILLGKFWPGLRAANGIAGATDTLCKLHGPRGYGDFVYYDPVANAWETKNKLIRLGANGLPDGSDVGRLWNEGLAFWGWWFYISKFYEVLDTFIILAKGKRSSTLQTYHHTGAMLCMWSGIRFMAAPIWMFCLLNSAIHTMMYIYYTLAALGIRVPQRIKRTLTTMQITQFLLGITFAGAHLFVEYQIPITTTETVTKTIESIASSASSAAATATATATAGVAAWLKQAVLRAAGEEGLAENVGGKQYQAPLGGDPRSFKTETRTTTGWETVPCIDTSGQAFAVWLNLAYLTPLTGLFVRFFIKSYSRRYNAAKGAGGSGGKARKSAQDAAHGVDRKVEEVGKAIEKGANGFAKHANGNGNALNGHANGNGTHKTRKAEAEAEKLGAQSTVHIQDGVLREAPAEAHKEVPAETLETASPQLPTLETGEPQASEPHSHEIASPATPQRAEDSSLDAQQARSPSPKKSQIPRLAPRSLNGTTPAPDSSPNRSLSPLLPQDHDAAQKEKSPRLPRKLERRNKNKT